MKFRLLAVLVLITPLLTSAQEGFSPERLARTKQVVGEMVARKDYAGVNALIARHGQVVWAESFGFQDLEAGQRMQPDTIFELASLTKPITAAAVMMLYEEGHFLLEDPVAKYLPTFARMQVLATEGGEQTKVVSAQSQITIRELLTHTAGLVNFKGYAAAGITAQTDLATTVDKFAATPLSVQPGQAWRYDLSYDVLARLVEIWSGQPYDVFLRERLFAPLGMKDTGFTLTGAQLKRVAKVYRTDESGKLVLLSPHPVVTTRPVFIGGSGGLYATASDYLKFCQMLLNGGQLNGHRLLSPVTVDYMFQNHVPSGVMPADGPNGRKGFSQGLGGYVLVEPTAYEDVSVKGEFNGAGALGTFFWIDREHDLVGIWFAQRFPQVQTTLKRFKVLTYQALER